MSERDQIVNEMIDQLLKSPLGSKRRNRIELIVLPLVVPYKVIAEFYLRTQTQVNVFHSFHLIEIYPKLRLRQQDEMAINSWIVP